ncbi:MAG TPA: helix-turn-helix domain-containing protein [Candidatus Elarobacter sp.]|jgi:HTH-type transcriptional regulator/antitoxin HigA
MTAELDESKYAKILSEYKPRAIHSQDDNERAIAALERLYEQAELSPEQEALAEVLTTLIERFEEERYALNEASPADVLRELMQSNGFEQKDLAELVGSKGIASEILSGKRRISRSIAQLVANRFNVSYRLFM